jgi:hypothetical protein
LPGLSIVVTSVAAPVVALQLYNVISLQVAWPLLVAIAFFLGSGATTFILIVLSERDPAP